MFFVLNIGYFYSFHHRHDNIYHNHSKFLFILPQALQLDPQNFEALLLAGISLINQSDHAQALVHLRSAIQASPHRIEPYYCEWEVNFVHVSVLQFSFVLETSLFNTTPHNLMPHHTTPHHTTQRHVSLHHITPHNVTFHYTTSHYTTFTFRHYSTPLPLPLLHYTALHKTKPQDLNVTPPHHRHHTTTATATPLQLSQKCTGKPTETARQELWLLTTNRTILLPVLTWWGKEGV